MYTLLPRNDRFLMKDDISVDPEELLTYREWITSHDNFATKLAEELQFSCRNDLINRCSVLCDILQETGNLHINKHPLVDEGKNLLHLACFSNSTAVGCHLVSTFGRDLVSRTIPTGIYLGATPLHIACLLGNVQLIESMVETLTRDQCKALFNSEAPGTFFRHKLRVGGFPLTLATWACHKDLCKYLIMYGAQLDLQDSKGQTPIHSIIFQGQHCSSQAVDMMKWILSPDGGYLWWCLEKNLAQETTSKHQIQEYHNYILKIKDKEGLTALGLAGKLGVPEIIKLLISVEGIYCYTLWSTHMAKHVYYDMREIDPAVNSGPGKSLLEYITYMCNPKTLHILNEEPFNSLIRKKWQLYKYFPIVSSVLHFTIMLLFTTTVLLNNNDKNVHHKNARICGEYIVALSALVYLAFEVMDIITSIRDWCRIHCLPIQIICKPDAFRPIVWAFGTQILIAALLRSINSQTEDICRLIAGIAGWYMLVGFTRVLPFTCFLTTAVHHILIKDLLRFCILTGILIIGFSLGLSILLQNSNERNGENSFDEILLDLFALTTRLTDPYILSNSSLPTATIVYIVLFVLLSSLMISLLIASVTHTYMKIFCEKDTIWKRNILLEILTTERRLYRFCMSYIRPKYLEYNTKLSTWLLSVEEVKNS